MVVENYRASRRRENTYSKEIRSTVAPLAPAKYSQEHYENEVQRTRGRSPFSRLLERIEKLEDEVKNMSENNTEKLDQIREDLSSIKEDVSVLKNEREHTAKQAELNTLLERSTNFAKQEDITLLKEKTQNIATQSDITTLKSDLQNWTWRILLPSILAIFAGISALFKYVFPGG